MPPTIRIHVGCRVSGSYGPLIANPNGSKRHVRGKVLGTVIKAVDQHKWEVVFDYDGVTRVCRSNSLTIVPNDSGIPLNEASVSDPVLNTVGATSSIGVNAAPLVSTITE